jgi:hypothetical protein
MPLLDEKTDKSSKMTPKAEIKVEAEKMPLKDEKKV